ncbi:MULTISPECIES: DUF2125 domain-containing protein [Methylobacterium]|uniref:DUF2125 domain-containing protein n=1 Tax=Methylobacterium longum TaxID=767694 RepID=A0ABT8AN97_9HYPH|nr:MULTISPECIES: DUF2125 domain-containing protein [Methylobacterium]MCJ2102683.1 DUF2125 domain-containing protein [Methylobacterium sp. E-046]MDN3571075.1 DUF2125 domain-containing protein [Methylobacterium longum]GJE13070.1 hypothetical protein FOHLNKBM_4131 [Methylobacterium longum]
MVQERTRSEDTAQASPGSGARRSRLGLFLPYVLLAIVVVGWSAAWFWIRARTADEIDGWIAREAAAGRTWTCADRSLGGYPFRIELRCSAVTLERVDGRFRLGPSTAVAQIYQPRLVVFESAGPFHVEQGDLTGDASWKAFQGSFHGAAEGFTRASAVIDAPNVTVTGAEPGPIAVSGRHLEVHARPAPGRYEAAGAVDVSLRLVQAASPQLDALTATRDPADLALDATLTQATVLRTGTVARELERWRQAGGALDLTALSLAKGAQRVQAKGTLALDNAHRPAGQIDLRAAGVDALIGSIVGQRFGSERGALVGQLVGGLLGLGRRPDAEASTDTTPLKALPPLRLVDGKLVFSGFPIPNVSVPALY